MGTVGAEVVRVISLRIEISRRSGVVRVHHLVMLAIISSRVITRIPESL